MARTKKLNNSIVELADQNEADLRALISFQASRILELEQDADWAEDNRGETLLPLLRGLVKYLSEEFLDEDVSESEVPVVDPDDEEEEEETNDELDF